MKETILKLKAEGKTYKEIQELLGCSKGTISYHCGDGQREKTNNRRQKRRENIIIAKTDTFKYTKGKEVTEVQENKTKSEKYVKESVRKFQKRDNNVKEKYDKNITTTFTWEDVLEKFGEDTVCYLSGEKINLYVNNYNFDHITPVSKGGLNTFDNLGVLTEKVNRMKSDMTPEELIEMCSKILKHNGYEVNKK